MPPRKSNAATIAVKGAAVLREVLASAEPRPDAAASPAGKGQYAVRFAEKMGEVMARDLSPRMAGIQATTKRGSASASGKKQLDINFSTPDLGLALGISLKSVHIREATGSMRYTHNMKRNEEELRIEAAGYHKRQPYAVMVGVLFLPFDSCADAKGKATSSSFGSWVRHLRPYTGRDGPVDEGDRFERLYVALYDYDDPDLRFFDVRAAPPKNAAPPRSGAPLFAAGGRSGDVPQRLLSYAEFLDEVYHAYLSRNSAEFAWSDGEEEPLAPTEMEQGDEDS
jgi:hypothetical protein